jgi:hypothetical protein
MLTAMLLATAAPMSAVEAERAFAADAQKLGQWTAFRKWADPTAIMWTPQAVWAADFLRDRKDPANAVQWWPSHSWQSCDGRTAVNIGAWRLPQSHGRWITLWMRQPSGEWRWTADGRLTAPARFAQPVRPIVRKAACGNSRLRARLVTAEYARPVNRTAPPGDSGYARSADGTLLFSWTVAADGVRRNRVQLWTGRRFALVLDEKTAPTP